MTQKRKPNRSPRRKRFRRAQRLASAKGWLPTYPGNKLFQAYRKRYAVDWQTAFTELEMLGVTIDPAYKDQVLRTVQRQAERKRQQRLDRRLDSAGVYGLDYDDNFAVIIGYTSG